MPKLPCVAALSLFLASACPALAQSNDAALADRLFREGALALKEGDVDTACEKLDRSNTLDAAIGTLGLLALCHERQGRLATAVSEYRTVSSLARSAKQPERAAIAAERVKALAPHISYLQLTLPQSQRDLVITINGRRFTREESTQLLPFDPGWVTVRVSAVHFEPWTTRVAVRRDNTTRVVVPELDESDSSDPPRAESAASVPIARPAPKPEPRPVPHEPASHAPSATTWVAWGIGAAGLATGSVLGLSALAAQRDSRPHCVGNDCDATGVSLRDTALERATVSTVGFAVGAAATGFGIYWYLAHDRASAPLTAGFGTLRDGGTFTVGGRF